jgi:hypothetical protein
MHTVVHKILKAVAMGTKPCIWKKRKKKKSSRQKVQVKCAPVFECQSFFPNMLRGEMESIITCVPFSVYAEQLNYLGA